MGALASIVGARPAASDGTLLRVRERAALGRCTGAQPVAIRLSGKNTPLCARLAVELSRGVPAELNHVSFLISH